MPFAFRGTDSATAWRDWHGTNVAVDDEGVRIAPAPEPTYGAPEALPVDFEPEDIAVDDCGDLYLLSPEGTVHRYDPVRGDVQQLSCTWHADEAGEAVAIAVTRRSVYLAGDAGHLQAYARRLRQTRWILTDPFESPVALATMGDTLLVLDNGDARDGGEGGSDGDNGDGGDGDNGDGAGFLATVRDGGVTDRVVTGLTAPVDVAAAGDRTHVLSGADGRSLATYDADFARVDATELPEGLAPACLAAEPDGHPIVGVGAADGERSPVRYRDGATHRIDGASGTTSALAYAAPAGLGRPEGLYAVLGEPLVEGGPRPHFREASTVRRSNHETDRYDAQVMRRFDSGERGTQWHRFTADLSLADSGTQVRLRYLATDDGDLQYSDATVALESVAGIGDVYAARLRGAGVRGVAELVEQTPMQVARAVESDDPEVPTEVVEDWLDEGRSLLGSEPGPIDPEAIDGLGPTYAERLREAGIEDVATLVDRTPAAIARLVDPGITQADVQRAEGMIQGAKAALADRNDVRGLEWTTMEEPNPRDALLRDAEGRYLWIELDLVGDRVRTPVVDDVRAYFPRQSYLRHLPAVYREDAESAAFLERFLSIFESVFTDVDEAIAAMTRYFDPAGAPPEALSWLGDWLAVEAGEAWPDPARRDLVAQAPSLYKRRGTRGGLLEVLRIYLRHTEAYQSNLGDPSDGGSDDGGSAGHDASGAAADDDASGATVDEDASGPTVDDDASGATAGEDGSGTTGDGDASGATDRAADSAVYLFEHGDLDCIDDPAVRRAYERLVPCPQCFLVLVRSWFDDEAVRTVDRIVEREQPAHAVGNAVRLRPWIQLGGNAFLGIDSRLPARDFTVEDASLGVDSVLAEREADGQLGIAASIGQDTTIS